MTSGGPGEQSAVPRHATQPDQPPSEPAVRPIPPGQWAPPERFGGALPSSAADRARPPARRFGVAGAGVTLVGFVAVVLAFTVLRWFRNGRLGPFLESVGDNSKFGQISDSYDKFRSGLTAAGAGDLVHDLHLGVGPTYFDWLAWVLLAGAGLAAVLAVTPTAVSPVFRVLGPVVAVAAIGLTFWAIYFLRVTGALKDQLGGDTPGYSDYLSHAYVGFWFAVGGFLLIGLGAAIGPHRA